LKASHDADSVGSGSVIEDGAGGGGDLVGEHFVTGGGVVHTIVALQRGHAARVDQRVEVVDRQAVGFDDPSWKPPPIPKQSEDVQVAVVRETLNSFEKGEEPVLSYKKALHASEVIFGLYESARSRRRVEFPLAIEDHPLVEMAAQKA